MSSLKEVCSGLPLDPLPPNEGRDPSVPHAPVRAPDLTAEEERVGNIQLNDLTFTDLAF